MRYALVAFTAAAIIAYSSGAWANMPPLTSRPRLVDMQSCQEWAASQDEDAIYMWGLQESGRTSTDVGKLRLTLYCLGDSRPEITTFSSSAASGQRYCKTHSQASICRELK